MLFSWHVAHRQPGQTLRDGLIAHLEGRWQDADDSVWNLKPELGYKQVLPFLKLIILEVEKICACPGLKVPTLRDLGSTGFEWTHSFPKGEGQRGAHSKLLSSVVSKSGIAQRHLPWSLSTRADVTEAGPWKEPHHPPQVPASKMQIAMEKSEVCHHPKPLASVKNWSGNCWQLLEKQNGTQVIGMLRVYWGEGVGYFHMQRKGAN